MNNQMGSMNNQMNPRNQMNNQMIRINPMHNQMNPINNQMNQMNNQMQRQMNPMANQMNPMNRQMNNQMNPNSSQMNTRSNQMNQANDPTNCMNKINRLLPPEMLERILSLLEPKDLKNAVLVCKLWAKVGTIMITAYTPFISWGLSSFFLFSIIKTLISTLIFCSFSFSKSSFTFIHWIV